MLTASWPMMFSERGISTPNTSYYIYSLVPKYRSILIRSTVYPWERDNIEVLRSLIISILWHTIWPRCAHLRNNVEDSTADGEDFLNKPLKGKIPTICGKKRASTFLYLEYTCICYAFSCYVWYHNSRKLNIMLRKSYGCLKQAVTHKYAKH